MSEAIYVATHKGLFTLARKKGAWDVADIRFLGDPVTAVFSHDGHVFAALAHGHFGPKLQRRDRKGKWREVPAPTFPPKPEDAKDDPHPWTLGKIWAFAPGGVPGRIWAGTMPGGLFRTDDGGDSWQLNETLWRMPDRLRWIGVAGGEQPGINSVLVHPTDPDDVRIGVSCAGVWETKDAGATWANINHGMYNEYLPPATRGDPIAQDVHLLARCQAKPDVMWCQHHNGVFRSADAGHNWTEIKSIRPSKFGFAVVAHPTDANTAWFVPAIKDEKRVPVDGKLVVARTRDGGKSFRVLRKGLPQRHAYDLVWRHGFAIDGSGEGLALGSTSGGLWTSDDGGDSWTAVEARLPPIAAVGFG